MKAFIIALGTLLSLPTFAANVEVKSSIPTQKEVVQEKVRPLPQAKTVNDVQSNGHDFWFHNTWLRLTYDYDYDGYASAFTLTMDADTYYNEALVYAVVYLGENDYYSSLHVTRDFVLYGDSSHDELTLDIDLLTGYPARDYNVMVELYDAYNGDLLSYVTYYDDSDLAYQPLESRNFDVEYVQQSVVVEHYGGSTSWQVLVLLLSLVVVRQFIKKAN